MKIGGLQKTTLIDYPGEIACIVFLIGCNFRCPFCYSKELVEEDPNGLFLDEEDFFSFLKKRKGQLDACVICGGEPTLNKEIFDFCKRIKSLDYKVKLDTNGSNPEVLKKLIKENLIDYVAMDVKAPFSKYDKATGAKVDVFKIKESINIIKDSGVDYEFRTTIVPQIHTLNDLKKIALEISPAKRYFIQNFRNDKDLIDPDFKSVIPFNEFEIQKVINEIKQYFEICYLR
ncbi:MAG: anaerobic ribonucleoside-triphosphate reductase activating protein [Candidatus Pacebacteria bacterium]|nr:anaerobic ribonucleoside-triphosphate reductase activating protein [Candidatus Paceibacterota bacterium]